MTKKKKKSSYDVDAMTTRLETVHMFNAEEKENKGEKHEANELKK